MFFSTNLLSRKTAIGALWIVAHGKRLSRNAILAISIADACAKIQQPDVPQSLRLQSILIGGLVMVFKKQQSYLLDDMRTFTKRMNNAYLRESDVKNLLLEESTNLRKKMRAVTNLISVDQRGILHIEFPFQIGPDLSPALPQDDDEWEAVPILLEAANIPFAELANVDPYELNIDRRTSSEQQTHGLTADDLNKELPLIPDLEMLSMDSVHNKTMECPEMEMMEIQEPQIFQPETPQDNVNAMQINTPEPQPRRTSAHLSLTSSEEYEAVAKPKRKRGKPSKVDESRRLLIGSKRYQSWLKNPTSDLTISKPRMKKPRLNNDASKGYLALRKPCLVTKQALHFPEHAAIQEQRPPQRAKKPKTRPLNAESEGSMMINLHEGMMDTPVAMEVFEFVEQPTPMHLDLEMEFPGHTQSQGEASMPSQIDKLRAALSSPITAANFEAGKTPGSSVKPNMHDGSDLSSLNASRKTSTKRGTPGATALSYTPSYTTDQPLMPILEEDHISGQENINPGNFLPETSLRQSYLNVTPQRTSPPVHQSTLAVIECLRQMLEDNALDESETTLFQLSSGLTRLQAAKLFYQICVLHSHEYIQVRQSAPYEDISIQAGPNI